MYYSQYQNPDENVELISRGPLADPIDLDWSNSCQIPK
jgi:hypothetical protein